MFSGFGFGNINYLGFFWKSVQEYFSFVKRDIKIKILLHENFVNKYGEIFLYLFNCSFFSFVFLR